MEKIKSKVGGARKGAGRHKLSKTLITTKMREMLAETLEKRFKPMIEAQLDSAIGVTSEKFDRKSGLLYYVEESPNVSAAKFLTEQVLGRAKETVEHSGEIKGLVGLITQLNQDEESD